MAGIDTGRKRKAGLQIENDVIKVLVVGSQGCGKTTIIEKYAFGNIDSRDQDRSGAIAYYHDSFSGGEVKRFAYLEIPDAQNVAEIVLYHTTAIGCIFMYAIDNPSSFQNLHQWITNVSRGLDLNSMKRILVGFKKDLRDNPQAVPHFELENRTFITEQQGKDFVANTVLERFFECHQDNWVGISDAFNFILTKNDLIDLFKK